LVVGSTDMEAFIELTSAYTGEIINEHGKNFVLNSDGSFDMIWPPPSVQNTISYIENSVPTQVGAIIKGIQYNVFIPLPV